MDATTATHEPAPKGEGLEAVDLVLEIVESLAASDHPRALSDLARTLGISKPRMHRYLRTLLRHDYVRQESETDRYEISAKLLSLGEAVRDRFEIARVVRPEMSRLRDATGHSVTASALIAGSVTIIEMLYGRTLVEFGIRPGAAMDPFQSAHGLVALAFGPAEQIKRAWPDAVPANPGALAAEVALTKKRGWATAADRILVGVNALAAPIFDHRGQWRGNIALVGATRFIPAEPAAEQISEVLGAAREVSRRLGWSEAR
jgi:IclR family acetate operon transcriptional repressor